MWIGQANGFHRPETQRFAAPFGHHFNRQASIKIPCCFTFMKFGFFRLEQRIDKAFILAFIHRAV